jgi:hypothetical protein
VTSDEQHLGRLLLGKQDQVRWGAGLLPWPALCSYWMEAGVLLLRARGRGDAAKGCVRRWERSGGAAGLVNMRRWEEGRCWARCISTTARGRWYDLLYTWYYLPWLAVALDILDILFLPTLLLVAKMAACEPIMLNVDAVLKGVFCRWLPF